MHDLPSPEAVGLFRAIFEQAAVGVAQVETASGRFVRVNQRYCDLVGYPRAELERLNFQTLTYPEDLPADLDNMRRLVAGEIREFTREKRYRRRDGHIVWVNVTVSPLWAPGEAPEFHVAVAEDITARKEMAAEVEQRNRQLQCLLVQHERAEDLLRESEARLRAVIEHAPFGAHSYVLEPDGRLLLTGGNPSADRILGINHALLVGRTMEEAFPGLRGTEIPEAYRRLAANGGSFAHDQVVYEGSQIKGAFAIQAFHTGPNRMTVFFQDITERQRAQQTLTESEVRFRSIVQQSSDVIALLDPEGLITYISPQSEHVLGYRPEGLVGRNSMSFIHEDDVSLLQAALSQVVQRINPGTPTEFRFRHADGHWAQLEALGTNLLDHPGIRGLLITCRDVTERNRAQEALREKTEELDRFFTLALDLFCIADTDGYFRRLNPQWEKVLGYSLQELEGCRFLDLVHPDDQAATLAAVAEIANQKAVLDFANRYRCKDGSYRWIEWRSQPAGGLIYAAARDITERRRAVEEREELQAQLIQAQKMESVGRLAGGVAHDFNNMLQVTLGNAALALEDLPPDSPLRESLEEIQKSAQRSADLTRQLLAFARKQTINPKVLDLNDTVGGMLKMLRRLIGEDIDLAWMPGAELWPVKVDPSQIDQILANLCVNARDAIVGTGKVTIETNNVTLDDAYAKTQPECVPGDYVMMTVNDTGQGMDAVTRAHLFEPFFTTKDVGKGTGLGLATVFGIVKQNQGLIHVYSEPGLGTTFRIYLPRAGAKSLVASQKTSQRLLRGTETVLLVEDEEQILNLGRRILTQQGYTVRVAPTPEVALAVAAEHTGPIHLLITDVVMPGMNGKELRERLRASHPDLKCLFISGYTADVIAYSGVLDEGVEFLQKPFTADSLATRVREVLELDAV